MVNIFKEQSYSATDIAKLYPNVSEPYIKSLISQWKSYFNPYTIKSIRGLFYSQTDVNKFNELFNNRPAAKNKVKQAKKLYDDKEITDITNYVQYNKIIKELEYADIVGKSSILIELRNYITFFRYGKQLYVNKDQEDRVRRLATYFIDENIPEEYLPNIYIKYEIIKDGDQFILKIRKSPESKQEVINTIKEDIIKIIKK